MHVTFDVIRDYYKLTDLGEKIVADVRMVRLGDVHSLLNAEFKII